MDGTRASKINTLDIKQAAAVAGGTGRSPRKRMCVGEGGRGFIVRLVGCAAAAQLTGCWGRPRCDARPSLGHLARISGWKAAAACDIDDRSRRRSTSLAGGMNDGFTGRKPAISPPAWLTDGRTAATIVVDACSSECLRREPTNPNDHRPTRVYLSVSLTTVKPRIGPSSNMV